MIDTKTKYTTRDGRPVRIYATDGWGCFPVHGAMATRGEGDRWLSRCWRADGSANISGQSANDLVEVKPRHKRAIWVNAFDDSTISVHETKESADRLIKHRIACIRVDLDFEEGEGL